MSTTAAFDFSRSLSKPVLRHKVHQITSVDGFLAMRGAWDGLLREAEDCPAHMAFDYCRLAASRVLAAGGVVKIAMVFRGHELVALWPVSVMRRGLLRVAQQLTCGTGEEYGGPLVKGKPDNTVYESVVAAIRQVGADVVEIPLVRDGSPLQIALESVPQSWVLALLPARRRGLPGYSLSLREFARWEDFLKTRPKSLRDTLRRRHKRLEERGHVEFGWCRTADDAASVLTWLFDNKRRWAERRGFRTSYLMNNQVRDFFIELARITDPATTPLVAFVKVDDVPVAATINLVGSRTVESAMTTYDEAFAKYSVGNLLTEFQARWSHANGRDLDLRAYYADYKVTWANRQAYYQNRPIFLTARGRLAELSLLGLQFMRLKRKIFNMLGRQRSLVVARLTTLVER